MYNKYGFDIRIQESTGEPYCRIVVHPRFASMIRKLNNDRYRIANLLDYITSHRYHLKWYLCYDPYNNSFILKLEGSVISMLQFRYDYENIINAITFDGAFLIMNRNACDL